MKTARISVTELQSYQLFLHEEWMTSAKLLEQLRGGEEMPEKVRVGSCMHDWLEKMVPVHRELRKAGVISLSAEGEFHHTYTERGRDGKPDQDYTFHFRMDLDAVAELPIISECKVEYQVDIGDVAVTLVGKTDHLSGRDVADYKFSEKFDSEKYMDSMQWKSYLMMFMADKFTYKVFTCKEKDGIWVISDLDELTLYRYPGMELEVISHLGKFVSFLKTYLPERIKDDESE